MDGDLDRVPSDPVALETRPELAFDFDPTAWVGLGLALSPERSALSAAPHKLRVSNHNSVDLPRLALGVDCRQVGSEDSAFQFLPMNFIQITPFMHVGDLESALAFFNDIVGFKALIHTEDYAYIEREGVGIRILKNHGSDGAPPGNRRFAYYVDVRDVDALYAELKPKLDTLPKGDVHGPADKLYGQRELLVLAPDGNLLAFGQAIKRSETLPSGR
jgi:hypothetical protein